MRRAPAARYPAGLEGMVRQDPGFTGTRPNIVLIVADDLGWGDLSCHGSQAIRTRNLDRLAAEGIRFTDFHAWDAVCTPSRAGLLTGRYTEEAFRFLKEAADRPFFLYFAHTFPHRSLAVSEAFAGSSAGGLYGDVVTEMDASVGRILDVLDARGLTEHTLVLFTSDNGPWYDGSPGPFRGRKGESFEGGHRVPFLARAPGLIPPGSVCRAAATNLDVFPTCLAVAGLAAPTDRVINGLNVTAMLRGAANASPHEYIYLYHHGELEGVRW